MVFKTKVAVSKGKFTQKELKVRLASAELFASSPFLTKGQKKKRIDELFK